MLYEVITNILFEQGWDFADDDNDPIPDKNCNPFPPIIPSKPEEHGTLVTGVIASAINDNFGLAGVGNFDILPVKVLNECGGGFASRITSYNVCYTKLLRNFTGLVHVLHDFRN